MRSSNEEEDLSQTIASIREKFRQQKRNEALQKSFSERRKNMMKQHAQKNKKKENQIKLLNQQFARQEANNKLGALQPALCPQPSTNQNLCFNLNIGNVNIQKNNQNFCGSNMPINNIHPIQYNQNNQPFQFLQQIMNIHNLISPSVIPNPPKQMQMPNRQNHHVSPIHSSQLIVHKPVQNTKNEKKVYLKHKNYLIYDEIIGTGTYSKVYLGLDTEINVKIAVKEISQLQQNQIKVLMSVQSPYIIKLKYFWKDRNTNFTYLFLQLCKRNLRQQMKRGISIDQKLKYFTQIMSGINSLFEKNIIHRDLKFENILVTEEQIAKITDFGLAKDLGLLSNVASLRCGTPYTMAPEIFFHNGCGRPYYSQKCDIWSLAIILHQMLYNKHPYNCQSQKMMRMDRVYIEKKYGYLDLMIDRALVKDPKQRIGWEQFKTVYDSKGYQKRLPRQIKSQNTQMLANFKKKQLTQHQQVTTDQQSRIQIKFKQKSGGFLKNKQPKKQSVQYQRGQWKIQQKVEQFTQQNFRLQLSNTNQNQNKIISQKVQQQFRVTKQQIEVKQQNKFIPIIKQLKQPSCEPMQPIAVNINRRLSPAQPIYIEKKQRQQKQKIKNGQSKKINFNPLPNMIQQNKLNVDKPISNNQKVGYLKQEVKGKCIVPNDIFESIGKHAQQQNKGKQTLSPSSPGQSQLIKYVSKNGSQTILLIMFSVALIILLNMLIKMIF